MIKLGLTPSQGNKLEILTLYYFPQITKVEFGTRPVGFIRLYRAKYKPSYYFHWFEWTMIHLSNALCNRHGLFNHEEYERLKKQLTDNYYGGEFIQHPIDLLYKLYLNELTGVN